MTDYELELRPIENAEIALVALIGELDLTNTPEVERRLQEMGNGALVLDLNRVTFVDSAALHMLFRLARRHGPTRRFGILLEPTALVASTLSIVGLKEVADVRPSLDELLAALTV